jgi:hypothetical protein
LYTIAAPADHVMSPPRDRIAAELQRASWVVAWFRLMVYARPLFACAPYVKQRAPIATRPRMEARGLA